MQDCFKCELASLHQKLTFHVHMCGHTSTWNVHVRPRRWYVYPSQESRRAFTHSKWTLLRAPSYFQNPPQLNSAGYEMASMIQSTE